MQIKEPIFQLHRNGKQGRGCTSSPIRPSPLNNEQPAQPCSGTLFLNDVLLSLVDLDGVGDLKEKKKKDLFFIAHGATGKTNVCI